MPLKLENSILKKGKKNEHYPQETWNSILKKEHDIPLEQIRPSHIHQYQNFLEKRELSLPFFVE